MMELEALTELTFTPERTRRVLTRLCALLGVADDAHELRHQTNAVYHVPGLDAVVKIARPSMTHLDKVVATVQWLTAHGVPTVELIPDIPQPITLAGCSITLWRHLPQHHAVAASELAQPLHHLHNLGIPTTIPLAALNAPRSIARSITASRILTPEQRRTLQEHHDELATAARELTWSQPRAVLHGDPQHRNALHHPNTHRALLCDWDSIVTGPTEWDLVTIEIHCRRFGHPPRTFDAFCRNYGFDIRDWPGYHTLRRLRELRMITTNARKSPPGTPAAREVHQRIAQLNAPPNTPWNIL